MTKPVSINISMDKEKIVKLKTITKVLYESGSINSDEIEEFIRFTLFIVFDEYEKNIPSLKKFYSINLAKYLEDKNHQTDKGS
jgi:hypothetical protein